MLVPLNEKRYIEIYIEIYLNDFEKNQGHWCCAKMTPHYFNGSD